MKPGSTSFGWTRAGLLGIGLLLGSSLALAQDPAQTPPERTEKQMDTQHAMHTWDEFLGQHPELREQLNNNPKLVNDPQFRAQHSDLQSFLGSHPGIEQGLKKNPDAMMKRARHYARSKHAGDRHPNNDPDHQHDKH